MLKYKTKDTLFIQMKSLNSENAKNQKVAEVFIKYKRNNKLEEIKNILKKY